MIKVTRKYAMPSRIYVYAQPAPEYYTEDMATVDNGIAYHASPYENIHSADMVLVASLEVTLEIPAGVDIIAGMVENIEETIKKEKADSYIKVTEMEDKIKQLLALPAPEPVEPENSTWSADGNVEEGVIEVEVGIPPEYVNPDNIDPDDIPF